MLVAEREGVGAPADGRVLDPAAAWYAVSDGRLVVGGLVCEGRGREYACGGVDLVDISFQQRSAAAAARRRSRG